MTNKIKSNKQGIRHIIRVEIEMEVLGNEKLH